MDSDEVIRPSWSGFVNSDKDGKFLFSAAPKLPLRLLVHGFRNWSSPTDVEIDATSRFVEITMRPKSILDDPGAPLVHSRLKPQVIPPPGSPAGLIYAVRIFSKKEGKVIHSEANRAEGLEGADVEPGDYVVTAASALDKVGTPSQWGEVEVTVFRAAEETPAEVAMVAGGWLRLLVNCDAVAASPDKWTAVVSVVRGSREIGVYSQTVDPRDSTKGLVEVHFPALRPGQVQVKVSNPNSPERAILGTANINPGLTAELLLRLSGD